MAAKTTKIETTTATTNAGPRWSIGLFRNDKGKLCTVYVTKDGTPMPYEAKRVGGRDILLYRVYSGIKYSAARQELVKEAKKAGIKDGPVVTPKAEALRAEPPKKAQAKKPTATRKPVAAK